MTVRRAFVSEMNNAVYLLTSKSSGEQILIDAADDMDALLSLLSDGAEDVRGEGPTAEPRLRLIVTTHAHWDHTRATRSLGETTGAKVVIGKHDADQLLQERGVQADVELRHEDSIEVDGIRLEVIALRGHTPGSVALATTVGAPTLVFTGDSLFPGGVGNTGSDPARFTQLFADVCERIFDRYEDDTRVLPGHGGDTTLGAERPSLPAWRERGW